MVYDYFTLTEKNPKILNSLKLLTNLLMYSLVLKADKLAAYVVYDK